MQSLDLDVVYTFDTEGKVATVTYPNGGPTYQNQYDTMGRLSGMIQNLIRDGVAQYVQWAGNAVYGPAGELKQMQWVSGLGAIQVDDNVVTETRTYNSRLQLTGLSSSSNFTNQGFSRSYNYSPANNNGQIVSMTDNAFGGETVSYTYDALKRLITASSSTASWGQRFAYDGFGNMTNQTVTQGSAPSMTLLYDNNTNRILTAGYSYDANGNMTGTPSYYNAAAYDASNRMVTAFASGGYQQYGYAPDNKRIYVRKPDGTEQIHFYSGNQRLGIYTTNLQSDGTWHLITVTTQKYFGGRKIETMDRLGSDIRGTKYFPYGAEATATASDRVKFATYYRDSTTNLDYADQRFYSSTIGRFMSPDPYQASGGPGDPASWNRYAYTRSDPANGVDPNGLCTIAATYYPDGGPECPDVTSVTVSSGFSIPTGLSDFLADAQRYYAQPLAGGPGLGQSYPPGYAEFLAQSLARSQNELTVWYPVGQPSLPANNGNQQPLQPTTLRIALPFWQIPLPKYCGPGTGSGTPINQVDAICQQHDQCYQNAGVSGLDIINPFRPASKINAINACDTQLCNRLVNLVTETRTENGDAFFVGLFFSVSHGSDSACIP